MGSAKQLRQLFATLLHEHAIGNAAELWAENREWFCADFFREAQHNAPDAVPIELTPAIEDHALRDLDRYLRMRGDSLAAHGLRVPPTIAPVLIEPDIIAAARLHGARLDRARQELQRDLPRLTEEQRTVYNYVVGAALGYLPDGARTAVFLDAPGGCGKSFTLNVIINALRTRGKIVLAMASSGIAALLLEDGTTAHYRLRLPINLVGVETLNIPAHSNEAELLRQASLLVWDEGPMMHGRLFQLTDRMLRDVTQVDSPFGGKPFLVSGDFRQVLPVVPKGTPSMIVNATLLHPQHTVWQHFCRAQLTVNMRAMRLEQQGRDTGPLLEWSAFLRNIGDGEQSTVPVITLPSQITLPPGRRTQADLIDAIWGDCIRGNVSANELMGRAILSPKNDDVDDMNSRILDMLPGTTTEYLSVDRADPIDPDQNVLFPEELLNSISVSGLSMHQLRLKVGVPVVLLRNMSHLLGLANGTRLTVIAMSPHVIQCRCALFYLCMLAYDCRAEAVCGRIATGPKAGSDVLLPRIDLKPSDNGNLHLPFVSTRRQFPIRLAFAMTVNKSQGQTLERVGIYLPTPVFSHGQLYVAMSRVGEGEACTVLIDHEPVLPDGTRAPETPEERGERIARQSRPNMDDAQRTLNVVFQRVFTMVQGTPLLDVAAAAHAAAALAAAEAEAQHA
jgi:hypothetical protein